MYRADVAIDTEHLNTLQQVAEIVPEAIDRYARRELRPFASQFVDKRLRQEPPRRNYPTDYPLEWTSDRQRRAYFATDGFGAGIPYRRTHELVSRWQVRANYQNGLSSISIWNPSPVARYVVGKDQQRFHRRTGWPYAPDELQVLSIELNERIAAGLLSVVRQALEGRA